MASLLQPPATSALVHCATSSAISFTWYAMPDVVRCRATRAAAKAVLAGAIAANEAWYRRPIIEDVSAILAGKSTNYTSPDSMETPFLGTAIMDNADMAIDDAMRPNLGDLDEETTGKAPQSEPLSACGAILSSDSLVPPAFLAGGAGVVIGALAASLTLERWIFRRGERRRSEGVRAAHTRQAGVLAGVLVALSAAELAYDACLATYDED